MINAALSPEWWVQAEHGQHKGVRILVDTGEQERYREQAVSCGMCTHCRMYGDPRRGWCTEKKMMRSQAFKVVCRAFEAG